MTNWQFFALIATIYMAQTFSRSEQTVWALFFWVLAIAFWFVEGFE